jgi:hypothetical protein
MRFSPALTLPFTTFLLNKIRLIIRAKNYFRVGIIFVNSQTDLQKIQVIT